MQNHAIPCNTMQYHAIPCNTMQYNAIPCNTMQYHAIPFTTMQYHATPCNTMQYNAIQCNTKQYHASLITADGAYHCPVGSIMAIFLLWLLKEDLQIWTLNLPSIFRYLFPRASNLGGFVKSDFQPTWARVGEHYQRLSSGMMMMMMMMKMKYSSKNCQPSSLVSGMPHENVFFCVFYQE